MSIPFAVADYYTASYLNDPLLGKILGTIINSERRYLRNLANDKVWPTEKMDSLNSLAIAEVWDGALWETRKRLGRDLADAIVAQTWFSMKWPKTSESAPATFIQSLLASAKLRTSPSQLESVDRIFRERQFPVGK